MSIAGCPLQGSVWWETISPDTSAVDVLSQWFHGIFLQFLP